MAKRRSQNYMASVAVDEGPDFDISMNMVDRATASALGVIYARYSSHSQRDVSIRQQVEYDLRYAARQNIYIVALYADRHLTGRTDRRPDFHRMLRDAENGEWTFVVTWKNDRLARNRYDAAIYKSKLKKCGVRCLYSQEDIPPGPEGILLEAMLEGDAEYRSVAMAEDIKRGLAYNAANCMVTGSIPFGYRRAEDYRLELDPERAPIVKEIFTRFLAGWQFSDIAEDLNRRGIRTATGREWNKGSFHSMLNNERYTGVYIYGDVRIEGGIPTIISRDEWLAAQHRLHTKKHAQGRPARRADYLLTGKLFCGRCGSPMVGISGTSKGGAVHHYYACQGRRVDHKCTKKNVRQAWLEDQVCQLAMGIILQDHVIEWMADSVVDYQRRHRDDGTIAALKSQLKQAEAGRQNIMAALEAGIITASTKDRLLELEGQVTKLKDAIDTEKALRPVYARERIIYWLEGFRDGDLSDPAFRRKLVDAFVNAVYLYDDHIKLALNFTGRDSTVDLAFIEGAGDSGPACSYKVEMGPPNSTYTNTATLYFLAPVFVLVAKFEGATP